MDVAFHQTLWNVVPHCSGAARSKSLGVVFGGDVMRLFHGHLDECLTVTRASDGAERVPTQCALYSATVHYTRPIGYEFESQLAFRSSQCRSVSAEGTRGAGAHGTRRQCE